MRESKEKLKIMIFNTESRQPTWHFCDRKSNGNLVFYKMFDMNLNTQCIDIGHICICCVAVCTTAVVDYSALMHMDVRYVFIVHLHLFVHFSTTEAQTKAKAFGFAIACIVLCFALAMCFVARFVFYRYECGVRAGLCMATNYHRRK